MADRVRASISALTRASTTTFTPTGHHAGEPSEEGIVAELIEVHLVVPASSGVSSGMGWASMLVSSLPLRFIGTMEQEDIIQHVPIKKDVINSNVHENGAIRIYKLVMAYQESKGYLNYERVNARILACEVLKDWAYDHRTVDDACMNAQVIARYHAFVSHLLYYHDRWSDTEYGARSKYIGQPHGIFRSRVKETFLQTLVKVLEVLIQLGTTVEKAVQADSISILPLNRIDRCFQVFLDQAVCVTLFGLTDSHEYFAKTHGDVCVDFLSKHRLRIEGHSDEVFLGTDFGRVLDAAMSEADPHFFPVLDHWVVFEHHSAVSRFPYYRKAPAMERLKQFEFPAVLLGPPPRCEMLCSREESDPFIQAIMKDIESYCASVGIVPPSKSQRHCSITDFIDKEMSSTAGEVRARSKSSLEPSKACRDAVVQDLDDEPPKSRAQRDRSPSTLGKVSSRVRKAGCEGTKLALLLEEVTAKWTAGNFERTGISKSFLGQTTESAKITLVTTSVLQLATDVYSLLDARTTILEPLVEVCTQVGMMKSRQVLHTALAKMLIYVDNFVDSALQCHRIFEGHFFESLKTGDGKVHIDQQRADVQRTYRKCFTRLQGLRHEITQEVHKLSVSMPMNTVEEEVVTMNHLKDSMRTLSVALGNTSPSGYWNALPTMRSEPSMRCRPSLADAGLRLSPSRALVDSNPFSATGS